MYQLREGTRVPADFISSDLPHGHDTLWGWAAKWSPFDLPAKLDLSLAFAEETRELREKSAAAGFRVLDVEAPPALRAVGADTVPAFDMQLLFLMSRG